MREKEDERRQYREMAEDYLEPEKPHREIENRFDGQLPFISIAIVISTFLGLNSTVPGDDVTRQLLVLFVPIALGGLSYVANKACFHHGSKLAASGDWLAITLVLGWFLLMGATVGTIGFAGVSRDIVEAEKLRAPVQHMAKASRLAAEGAAEANSVLPLISGGAGDISGIAACESSTGCVSGKRGRGAMVEQLETLASRFQDIERTYGRAEKGRNELVQKLERLTSAYEAQLNQGGASGANRAKLLEIYNQAQNLMTDLANVVPTAATQGLVSELRSTPTPPARPGRIDVGARLRGHADRLEQALANVSAVKVALPPFPSPSGLTVGWERLDLTAPLAVVLLGLEAIVIVLWSLLVRDFIARRRSSKKSDGPPNDPHDGSDQPNGAAVAVSPPQPALANGDARLAGDGSDLRLPRPRRG